VTKSNPTIKIVRGMGSVLLKIGLPFYITVQGHSGKDLFAELVPDHINF
jgi:hypothetical protein